ncbi:cyanocobalamin reductase / alkylcobalamin dealkylase, partial [Octopus bimaculoides]
LFFLLQVKWYNDLVGPNYKLKYHDDTFALITISTPQMFEKGFKPFIYHHYKKGDIDPIDLCVKHYTEKVQKPQAYPDTDLIYDFDQKAPQHYSILVQTAAHVAGAAYYYQKKDVINNPWGDENIYGLSIHPKYGGWFAIRAAIIFKNLKFPDLKKKDPVDILPDQKTRINLLTMLNKDFKYWEARDIIEVSEKYTEEAIKYFKTMPKNRYKLIEEMLANKNDNA